VPGEAGVAPRSAELAPRPVRELGNAQAHERVWIQCDAAGEPGLLQLVAQAIIEGLAGDRPSRHRHLVQARMALAVVPPASVPGRPAAGPEVPPLFDAGALGSTATLLEAMDRFIPTLVLHLQDWPAVPTLAAGEGQGAGLRLVESFLLDTELHERIDAGLRARTRLGRRTAEAQALEEHPDARLGRLARRFVVAEGYRVFQETTPVAKATLQADPSTLAAIRIAPGRYIPRLPWRRLGGASLGELALSRYGAPAITAQSLGGAPEERAGQLLALVEGVLLARLGLEPVTAASS
jgi:hypothetical protein